MYGTPLSDIQLNATATWTVNGQTVNVPGTFTYSSPEGTVLPVATNLSLTVVFRPFDAVDYSTAVATTNITVTLGPPRPHRRHHHRRRHHPVADTITDAISDAGSASNSQ